MNIELAKLELKEKGYCSFNLEDFDKSLIPIIEKYRHTSEKSFKHLINSLRADFQVTNNLISTSKSINQEYKSFEEAEISKFEILKKGLNKNNFSQIWFYSNLKDEDIKLIYDKITKYFYDLSESDELQIELQYTLYDKGCFVKDHIDGKSPVKNYAAILIYLNEKYEKNWGGNLVLKGIKNNKEHIVIPEFGNVAIIDLQNFDINHEVTDVKENIERYAFVSFPFNKKNSVTY